MGMEIETRLSEQLARYLDLAASEAKLTAANMANIDTPGLISFGSSSYGSEDGEAETGTCRAAERPCGGRRLEPPAHQGSTCSTAVCGPACRRWEG